MPSKSNYLNKGLDFTKQSEIHETIRANGVKIDSHNTAQTSTNTKLDSFAGAPNNNIGMAQTKLQVFPYAHDTVNDVMKPLKLDASGRLECSVDALEVTAETINLSTNELETKVDAVTSKLDGFAGAPNNNLGTGASKLQTFPYGKDSANDIMRPIKVDAIGKVIVDSPAGSDLCLRLDAIQTAVQVIDNAISGNEMQCDIVSGAVTVSGVSTESKQDALITANHADLVALEASLTSIEGKIDTLDAVLDASLVKHTNNETLLTAGNVDHAANEVLLTAIAADGDAIQTKLDSVISNTNSIDVDTSSLETLQTATNSKIDVFDAVLDASLVKQTNIETLITATNSKIDTLDAVQDNALTKLGEIETSANALISANHTDLVALESSLTSIEGKIDTLDAVQDNALTKLGEIETSADALIAANHTDLVALESSLTSIEGKIDTLDAVLDASLVKHGNNETLLTAANVDHAANEVLLTAIAADGDAIQTKLDTIDGSINTIEGCVGSNKVNVNISSGGFDGAVTNAGLTELASAINSNRVDVNIANGGFDGAISGTVTANLSATDNAVLDAILAKNTEIETSADALIAANHTDLVALESSLTSIEGKIDTLDTVLDACLVKHTNNETLLTAANVDHDANETLLTQCNQKLGDIETAVQLIDNGYGTMTETELHNATVAASGNVVSSVFTKTREIQQFAFAVVAATNGSYDAFVEASVDNTTYFQLNGAQSFNLSGNAENFQDIGTAQISASFKYYRIRLVNNHSSGQGMVVKVCF